MTSEKPKGTPSNELWTDPSVTLWSAELHELLDGKRAAFIEHLADAAEYTEDQVRRSSCESESRAFLVAALDSIIGVWNASPHDDAERQSLFLDLLRQYTPPMGFPKLMRFLELPNVHPTLSQEYQRVVLLQRKALHGMENYFPSAPVSPEGKSTHRDDAFRQYLSVLRNLLGQPEHAAYGMRTLFKIGALPLDGDELLGALTDNPSAIRGILQYTLGPEHRAQAATNLSRLYNACLSLPGPAEEHFRVESKSLGASFKDAIDGPSVMPPQSSEEIVIEIQEEYRVKYSELCERRKKTSFDSRIRQLLATVPEEFRTASRIHRKSQEDNR